MTALLSLPMLLGFGAAAFAMIYESQTLEVFVESYFDIGVLDSGEYLVWTAAHQVYIAELNRMRIEGIFEDDQFRKFGFDSAKESIGTLIKDPAFYNQVVFHKLRMTRLLAKSPYIQMYNRSIIEEELIEWMDYDETNSKYYFRNVTVFNAAKLLQVLLDVMQKSEYQDGIFLNIKNGGDRKKGIKEELLRYNARNPFLNWILRSNLDSPVQAKNNKIFDDILKKTKSASTLCMLLVYCAMSFMIVTYSASALYWNTRLRSVCLSLLNFDVDFCDSSLSLQGKLSKSWRSVFQEFQK
jgi:hypothetical protein